MNASDVLSKLFMVIGILAFVAIMLYVIAKQIDKYKAPEAPNYPSDQYMQNIGAVCPTGWKVEPGTNGYVKCVNEYQIPQNLEGACSDLSSGVGTSHYKEFPNITKQDWTDFANKNIKSGSITARCNFVEKCGENGRYNSWIGVSNKC